MVFKPDNLTAAEYERATLRGDLSKIREPHATSARYDQATGKIVLELSNGSTFMVPARLLQGLEHADDADIAAVELTPAGYGLHWPRLDVDFTVPGLVSGIFGTKKYMESLRPVSPDRLAAG